MERHAATQPDELVLLFTPREAAERLRCSVNHIYRLIARAELRAVNIAPDGSRRPKTRIRSDDLARYVDNRTQGAPS